MIVLKDVLALLDGEVLTPGSSLEIKCPRAFASDLMSDVLTSAAPGSLLLTGLANAHVVCTCSLADIAAVVFVQGKRPDPGVVDEALSKGLPLLATRLPMFEACARLGTLFEDDLHGR